MKRLLLFLLLATATVTGMAQSTSCAQTLRLARSTYEQGRLHELEAILSNCLLGGFTTEEKVEAYKLLTLTYIYMEEPQKADDAMRTVLETDHFFQINPEIDPAEFVALYNTFRTEPAYSLGIKFGPSFVIPSVVTDYYTAGDANGTGKYTPGIGIQAGVFFEKRIFKKITIAPELFFATRQFSQSTSLFINDSTQQVGGTIESTYKQSWLDLNALFQYELTRNKANTFVTYAGLGPSISYSLSQTNQLNTTGLSSSGISGADVDVKSSLKDFFYSITAIAGFKYRIGAIYVHAELRYQQGLTNIVNEDTRTNQEVTFDYAAQHNDLTLNALTAAIGISYPFFKPMKLKK